MQSRKHTQPLGSRDEHAPRHSALTFLYYFFVVSTFRTWRIKRLLQRFHRGRVSKVDARRRIRLFFAWIHDYRFLSAGTLQQFVLFYGACHDLRRIAKRLSKEGKHESAKLLLSELAACLAEHEPDVANPIDEQLPTTIADLGDVHAAAGQPADARRFWLESIEGFRAYSGDGTPTVADHVFKIAQKLEEHGDNRGAAGAYTLAAALWKNAAGERDPHSVAAEQEGQRIAAIKRSVTRPASPSSSTFPLGRADWYVVSCGLIICVVALLGAAGGFATAFFLLRSVYVLPLSVALPCAFFSMLLCATTCTAAVAGIVSRKKLRLTKVVSTVLRILATFLPFTTGVTMAWSLGTAAIPTVEWINNSLYWLIGYVLILNSTIAYLASSKQRQNPRRRVFPALLFAVAAAIFIAPHINSLYHWLCGAFLNTAMAYCFWYVVGLWSAKLTVKGCEFATGIRFSLPNRAHTSRQPRKPKAQAPVRPTERTHYSERPRSAFSTSSNKSKNAPREIPRQSARNIQNVQDTKKHLQRGKQIGFTMLLGATLGLLAGVYLLRNVLSLNWMLVVSGSIVSTISCSAIFTFAVIGAMFHYTRPLFQAASIHFRVLITILPIPAGLWIAWMYGGSVGDGIKWLNQKTYWLAGYSIIGGGAFLIASKILARQPVRKTQLLLIVSSTAVLLAIFLGEPLGRWYLWMSDTFLGTVGGYFVAGLAGLILASCILSVFESISGIKLTVEPEPDKEPGMLSGNGEQGN